MLVADVDHFSRAHDAAAGHLLRSVGGKGTVRAQLFFNQQTEDVSVDTGDEQKINYFEDSSDYKVLTQEPKLTSARNLGDSIAIAIYALGIEVINSDVLLVGNELQETEATIAAGDLTLRTGSRIRFHSRMGLIMCGPPQSSVRPDHQGTADGVAFLSPGSPLTPLPALLVLPGGDGFTLQARYQGDAWTSAVDFDTVGYFLTFIVDAA